MPDTHLPFETVTIGTVLSGSGVLGIVALLIRQWGPWRKQASDERESDFKRLRDDIVRLENRLDTTERQNRALRMAFEHAVGALIRTDPANPALKIIDRIMAEAFPTDFSMPIARIDAAAKEQKQ